MNLHLTATATSQQGLSVGITVGITMGVVVILLTGAVLAILYKLRRRKKYTERMQRQTHGSTLDMHRYMYPQLFLTFTLYIMLNTFYLYTKG